jgi:nucleotide-binding universal stress UspA family protein
VIVCYDESKGAIAAIQVVAELLPGASVVVLTVWKPILDAILAVSLGPAPPITDLADVDERQRRAAVVVANDGAKLAEEAGLKAEPLAVKGSGGLWETIEQVADERDARLVACGASRAGVKSALLDMVPTALIHRASRPVLVVPSRDAAAERRREALEH